MTLRILAGIALVAFVLIVHTLDYRILRFEEAEHMAELGPASPGCKGDMLTGSLDCFYAFQDGTFIHKHGF